MSVSKDLRNMEVTTASGVDVKDTKQLSGEAKEGAGWNAMNQTKQYKTSNPGFGALGGEDKKVG